MDQLKLITYSVIAGLCAVLFLGTFIIVPTGHRGVVTHFSKVQDVVLSEGFHFKMPIMTSVIDMSIKKNQDTFESDAASKDLQEVKTHISVIWHLKPDAVNKVYQEIGDLDVLRVNIIAPAISEALKAATAQKNAEEILTKRVELKQDIDKALVERLAKYDLMVDDVNLVNVEFSKEFNEAVERKQVAEQDAKTAHFIALKAEQQAKAEINRAKGEAESKRLISLTVSPRILQLEAIQKWNGELPIMMGGNTPVPFLNFKDLAAMKSSGEEGVSK